MAVLSHLKIFSQALPQHALSCAHRQLGYTIYARASRTSRGAKLSCQHIKRSFPAVHMDNGHYNSARGSLIVLEGLDRSGKTSQCSNLLSYLRGTGLSVEAWRFPDRSTSIGQLISAYLANESQLDDKAIHLLFSANRWEKRALMENKLKSGITIVVDRYSYSGVAFSVAKGLDMGWCMALEMGLIAPDLVIFLDIPPEPLKEEAMALRGTSNLSSREKLPSTIIPSVMLPGRLLMAPYQWRRSRNSSEIFQCIA
ncbi:thymidylate kinase isoform X3 [Typha angustifolia]|uniref:thymidylate kinase isoform X3 n=1 Tax=Typha angustifolia TaxID=59011 RepID=UPI003C30A355